MTKAICKSSAEIDPSTVNEYRYTGDTLTFAMNVERREAYSGGERELSSDWNNGKREILSFVEGHGPSKPETKCPGWCGGPAGSVPLSVPTLGPGRYWLVNDMTTSERFAYCTEDCSDRANAARITAQAATPAHRSATIVETMTGNMPQVGEKPIDWARFVPTSPMLEQPNSVYTLADGIVFASWHPNSKIGSVRIIASTDRAPECLAGSAVWSSGHYCIIRHPDGTWAPGYGPSGPIAEPSVEAAKVRYDLGKAWADRRIHFGGLASTETVKPRVVAGVGITFVGCGDDPFADGVRLIFDSPRPFQMCLQKTPGLRAETVDELRARVPKTWGLDPMSTANTLWFVRTDRGPAPSVASTKTARMLAAYAIDSSNVAKLHDAPSFDSHRELAHMKPRWRTTPYETPGRWRK